MNRQGGIYALPPERRAGVAVGIGMGAIVTTFFGFVWFGWGLGYVEGASWPVWVALYAGSIALIVCDVRAVRAARKLLPPGSAEIGDARRAIRRPFWLITGAEFAGCGVVVALCAIYKRPDLIAVGISAVVGLHFAPLARVFRAAAYYWTAAAIVAFDILVILTLKGDAITAASGIATGAVLWVTAIYHLSLSAAVRRSLSGIADLSPR